MDEVQGSQYRTVIKDLPVRERPRERLREYGASSLSTAELVAILLRTGARGESAIDVAQRLLAQFNGLTGLARGSFAELRAVHGLGVAKAAQLKAALELGRRLLAASPDERPQIKSPDDVANLLMLDMAFLPQEQMRVILLDTKNRVLGVKTVYQGNVNTNLIRIAELFRDAVHQNCPAIILAHNHPSGDPTPSPDDVRVTEQIVEAGDLLDVQVLDHLIIGQQRYVSLKERRLGFS